MSLLSGITLVNLFGSKLDAMCTIKTMQQNGRSGLMSRGESKLKQHEHLQHYPLEGVLLAAADLFARVSRAFPSAYSALPGVLKPNPKIDLHPPSPVCRALVFATFATPR